MMDETARATIPWIINEELPHEVDQVQVKKQQEDYCDTNQAKHIFSESQNNWILNKQAPTTEELDSKVLDKNSPYKKSKI